MFQKQRVGRDDHDGELAHERERRETGWHESKRDYHLFLKRDEQ